MASLEQLVASLFGDQSQQLIAAENPYYRGRDTADAIGDLGLKMVGADPTRYGLGEIALVSGLSGLASGLFGQKGDQYQQVLTDRFQNVASGVDSGGELSPNLFGAANQQRRLFNTQSKIDQRDLAREIMKKGLETEAGELGKLRAYGETPGGAGASLMNPATQKQFDLETKIGADFDKKAQDYAYREEGFRAMVEAFQDQAGTSDFELIRRGSQAIEPGLAVRRDDEESLQGAASLLGLSLARVKNAVEGKSSLDPKVREGIMRMASRAVKAAGVNYNLARENAIERANAYGLDPERIIYLPEARDPADIASSLDPSIFQNVKAAPTAGPDLSGLSDADLDAQIAAMQGQ